MLRIASGVVVSLAFMLAFPPAFACDGKSYSFNISVGDNVSGGGVIVRLDSEKLFNNDDPDRYIISVKDDGKLLADHITLRQYKSVTFVTRCGTLSVGADRASMFDGGTLTMKWSYF